MKEEIYSNLEFDTDLGHYTINRVTFETLPLCLEKIKKIEENQKNKSTFMDTNKEGRFGLDVRVFLTGNENNF